MKIRLFAQAFLVLFFAISASGAEDYVRESGWAGETFTSRILKDFSFQDGGAEYTAYLVKWRDHEVVVSATGPLEKRYVVGDLIRCQMMRREISSGKELRSQITFMIFGTSTLVDPARLKAVQEEVARRRAVREKAADEIQARQRQE